MLQLYPEELRELLDVQLKVDSALPTRFTKVQTSSRDRPFKPQVGLASGSLKLTSGYPPLGTAFTSTNFLIAAIASSSIGGVRKSVCRTSLLNEARLA